MLLKSMQILYWEQGQFLFLCSVFLFLSCSPLGYFFISLLFSLYLLLRGINTSPEWTIYYNMAIAT